MNLPLYLTPALPFLLTSCASLTAFVPQESVTPAECRVLCAEPPAPRNPPREYAADLIGAYKRCAAIHEKCVEAIKPLD